METFKKIRCAVYTRKSTDEGLEKEFNTLEAQREAGENYIMSQKAMGWELIPDHYDDGGYSGGNMNRPALEQLFADIRARKVDMIVVYKIDRLTRSLIDFAKMMELFDAYNCSFVSVTQNFNTADSMGRLMLNVLLSFAQFEREISGERIRDKIAATRKKGMWTGGVVPFGYIPLNKKLVVKEEEAEIVRFMFEGYLKYQSITAVCKLIKENYHQEFRREMVKRILKNPIYIGKVKHKTVFYDGIHEPLVSAETFEAVAKLRAGKDVTKRTCLYKKNEVGILRGILICGCCQTRMTPTLCCSHHTRKYYYTSTKAKYYGYHTCQNGAVSVAVLDEAVLQIITPLLKDINVLNGLVEEIAPDKIKEIYKIMQYPDKVLAKMSELDKSLLVKKLIAKITVEYDTLEIKWTPLAKEMLPPAYLSKTVEDVMIIPTPLARTKDLLQVTIPEIVDPAPVINKELVRALAKAFKYQKILRDTNITITELAASEERDPAFLGRIIRLTSLAPDIIKAILVGNQPADFVLQPLLRDDIPPIWAQQRKLFNFPEI